MKAFATEGKTLSVKNYKDIIFVLSHLFEGQLSWNRSTPCSLTTGKQTLILYCLRGACVLRTMKTIRKIFLLSISCSSCLVDDSITPLGLTFVQPIS